MKGKTYIGVLILLSLASCKAVSRLQETTSELFGGEVVAKVGNQRLHRSQLESYIPAGVSSEDSCALARQYIQSWAQDILLMDMAEEQLSEQEKDVSAELEEYRKNLIKYRYEQLYIRQRLDTLVTAEEIDRYYQDNPERFRLERPVLKARYLIIPADARILKVLKEKISSDDDMEVMEVDSLASSVALKYVDQADTWADALSLARDAGVEYRTLVQGVKGLSARKPFVETEDEAGNKHVIFVAEVVPEGKTAPLEYCQERIREILLSARKHDLEESLEKSLMEDALRNNKFVIYENEK